ncbi:hypothetical protein BJ875DRAFT_372831 [Amylocarpus encephaloides]|uniref:Uncharacterized protein n=1 Tax=Amylocarpus encephaloides TaxID=45428 RepID=A0A9P7YN74_9HELO|nr:hypothetical protein BJ875DRAFT_372831 [Amylocarpus encephaloides]
MKSLASTILVSSLSFPLLAGAQRPSSVSICDFYAEKLFGNNTALTQRLVQTHILNTAIIGNYTSPNVGVSVTGIAPVSIFNGTEVNLLKYFDAALYSTNDGKTNAGVAKLFLDDGGPTPISMNMASNGNVNSAQYILLTHVWEYFGVLLNCSKQGTDASSPSYAGNPSMYEVHKYMNLDPYEQGWFVRQLALAAASIGFSSEDTSIWFNTMTGLFSSRCSPPTVVLPGEPELQAICIHDSCPLAANANCALYAKSFAPGVANTSLAGNYTKTNTSGIANATATGGYIAPSAAVPSVASVAWKLGVDVLAAVLVGGVGILTL